MLPPSTSGPHPRVFFLMPCSAPPASKPVEAPLRARRTARTPPRRPCAIAFAPAFCFDRRRPAPASLGQGLLPPSPPLQLRRRRISSFHVEGDRRGLIAGARMCALPRRQLFPLFLAEIPEPAERGGAARWIDSSTWTLQTRRLLRAPAPGSASARRDLLPQPLADGLRGTGSASRGRSPADAAPARSARPSVPVHREAPEPFFAEAFDLSASSFFQLLLSGGPFLELRLAEPRRLGACSSCSRSRLLLHRLPLGGEFVLLAGEVLFLVRERGCCARRRACSRSSARRRSVARVRRSAAVRLFGELPAPRLAEASGIP